MAGPPHQPSPLHRRQVEIMAACGVPETDVARAVGIAPKTLRKHYRRELDLGHVKASRKVAAALLRKATGGRPPRRDSGDLLAEGAGRLERGSRPRPVPHPRCTPDRPPND